VKESLDEILALCHKRERGNKPTHSEGALHDVLDAVSVAAKDPGRVTSNDARSGSAPRLLREERDIVAPKPG
jgi:hypothetical protein